MEGEESTKINLTLVKNVIQGANEIPSPACKQKGSFVVGCPFFILLF